MSMADENGAGCPPGGDGGLSDQPGGPEDASDPDAVRVLDLDAFTRTGNVEVRRAARYGRPLSMIVLSINGLATLRDIGGKPALARVLIRAGTIIGTTVRESDLLTLRDDMCFLLLLPETTVTRAVGLCERLIEALGGEASEGMTFSLGVTGLAPRHGGMGDIIAVAEQEVAKARARGGNAIAVRPVPPLSPTIANNGNVH